MTNKQQKNLLCVDDLRRAEYYQMQTTFDDLYSKSKNGEKFQNLMLLILSRENILLAYRNIKSNGGSKTQGTDNVVIDDIGKLSADEYVEKLRFIVAGSKHGYRPKAVRRKEIPKPNGKLRPLGIPCMWDRLVQQCIKQVMEPICEAKFSENSYGFRPLRSVEHAIQRVYQLMQRANLHYVVEFDIKGFFSVYIEIIQVLLLMESIGFDTKYLDKAVKQMLANIASTNNPKSLTRRFVFYEGTPAIACRAKQIISEIEEAIAQRNNTTRALSIEEALQQPDWAAQLLSLTGEKNRLSTGALISNTDSEVWIALLKTASPETINKFREWLSFVYSDDDISFEKKADIVILQKVSDGLNTNEFSDLIVKKSLQWLKGDIEKICAYYQ